VLAAGLYAGLSAELVFRNPDVDLVHTPYTKDAAAGALANKTGTLKLGLLARWPPWKWLEVYAGRRSPSGPAPRPGSRARGDRGVGTGAGTCAGARPASPQAAANPFSCAGHFSRF